MSDCSTEKVAHLLLQLAMHPVLMNNVSGFWEEWLKYYGRKIINTQIRKKKLNYYKGISDQELT